MTHFAQYLAAIRKNLAQGDVTEHTHRPALKAFLEAVGQGITATNEPKRIACGAPDISISQKKVPLGHIETKNIGVNLDEMERGKGAHGEQFTRYRDGLTNWILTDYLEFRWFVAGEKLLTARIARLDSKGKLQPMPDGEEELARLFHAFFQQETLTVGTAKELARRMAGMTRILRDLIIGSFDHEWEKGWLHNWLAAFREVLIPDLDEKQFADMFAQTIAYGLFAARVHAPPNKDFSRQMAAFNLPKTNPFLRKLFSEIAGVDMPETIDWAVDDLVELLKHADLFEILKDFGKGKGKQDPVVHFYETFLAAYDPKMRKLRGVYYTPEPVVSFIVRSVDHLLQSRFGRPKGLADENTLVLDPAAGTATFLYFVIEQIYKTLAHQRGAWDGYVAQHLLNRIFGFELLMAPYAMAHLKLGMELQQTGYTFSSDQRLGIYLTNTLEEAAKKSESLFAGWISEEANAAARIKRDLPIMVVMGNPPYSGHSANRSWEMQGGKKVRNFIGNLLQDYYQVDGQPLGERNPKWLQDDYVKFLRFGQWRIERTGAGILAFITNHGYLDNPTFRGMRQQLMNAFTDIYILDLHGNAKKKEKCPDGSKDENVFDIQQGVAIGIFVKDVAPASSRPRQATVHHAELWGLRESKYEWLFERDVATAKWKVLKPKEPFYLFEPQDTGLREEYEQGWKVTEIMPVHSLGITTARDNLTIRWSKAEVLETVRDFVGLPQEEARAKYSLGKDARDWRVTFAQQELRTNGIDAAKVKTILYRPFDRRFTYYAGRSRGFICMPRTEVMRHMLAGENLGLCTNREVNAEFRHVLCTRSIINDCTVSLQSRERTNLFPLYLYPTTEGATLSHWPAGPGERRPNLNSAFVEEMEKRLGLRFRSAAFQAAPGAGSAAFQAAPKASKDAGATGQCRQDGGATYPQPRTSASLGKGRRDLFRHFPLGRLPSATGPRIVRIREEEYRSNSRATGARSQRDGMEAADRTFHGANRKVSGFWNGSLPSCQAGDSRSRCGGFATVRWKTLSPLRMVRHAKSRACYLPGFARPVAGEDSSFLEILYGKQRQQDSGNEGRILAAGILRPFGSGGDGILSNCSIRG